MAVILDPATAVIVPESVALPCMPALLPLTVLPDLISKKPEFVLSEVWSVNDPELVEPAADIILSFPPPTVLLDPVCNWTTPPLLFVESPALISILPATVEAAAVPVFTVIELLAAASPVMI